MYRTRSRNGVTLLGLLAVLCAAAAPVCAAEWDTAAFAKADTIELRTVGAEEGEYWFKVWPVVVDGAVYVRLGTRAAQRVEANQTAPEIGVRLDGEQFDHVRVEPAPEYAERVAEAMADKYFSDVFVRWFSHPLTLRLIREAKE